MRLVLRQSFPLGRFHATPWRTNPFDDAFGEWPPSPWRLVRAVVARWYQWRRETTGSWPARELEDLVESLCRSAYSFYLPERSWNSVILRQYQPTTFEMDAPNYKAFEADFAATDVMGRTFPGVIEKAKGSPLDRTVVVKSKSAQREVEKLVGSPRKKWRGRNPDPGVRRYATSLAQDTAYCVASDEELLWFVEGETWTAELAETFDRCLERITYFGRAESFSVISRTEQAPIQANVTLSKSMFQGALIPVLVPAFDATRTDVERVTQDPLAARNIPQGARVLYARRPPRPAAREPRRHPPRRPETHILQFALGWAVPPEMRATVRLTAAFRSAVLRNIIRVKTGGATYRWSEASTDVREAIAGMTGKDSQGEPLRGPRAHAEFLLWWDGDAPTRLIVWRESRPFDAEEQAAILGAAAQELSRTAAGADIDAWKIKLIPLDSAVRRPPGFDETRSTTWTSMTPFVPPRHALRRGKIRELESVENQVHRELVARGHMSNSHRISVERIGRPAWVTVHVPRRHSAERAFIGDRRGYMLRLSLDTPISGPLRIGHSSSFGLGLFQPTGQ